MNKGRIWLIAASFLLLLCMNGTPLWAAAENATENEGFQAAAPFKHTLKITRSGRILKMDYQVIGTDGKTYNIAELNNYNYDNKPSVEIYKGNLLVGSGSFEYG